MSNYGDVHIQRFVDGERCELTIKTLFEAGNGTWETKIVDLTRTLTGRKIGKHVIGGDGLRTSTPQETQKARDYFRAVIRGNNVK